LNLSRTLPSDQFQDPIHQLAVNHIPKPKIINYDGENYGLIERGKSVDQNIKRFLRKPCLISRGDSMILTFHMPPLARGYGLCDIYRL